MKKFLLLLVIAATALTASAQDRTDSHGNTVKHALFEVAQYQFGDFDAVKATGSYGLGMLVTSLSHWDRFHVGANVNFSINNGLADPSGCIIDFGPSVRYDLSEHILVNMPVNAVCVATFPKGTTDTKTDWGARIAPSLHVFFSDKFGIFAGPQMTISFESGSEPSFGLQAGLSYAF
ncbi:MAG: hypothetical protein ACI4AM_04475 [Muribaculaceae bacterium]